MIATDKRLETRAQKRARQIRMNMAKAHSDTAMIKRGFLDGFNAGVLHERRESQKQAAAASPTRATQPKSPTAANRRRQAK